MRTRNERKGKKNGRLKLRGSAFLADAMGDATTGLVSTTEREDVQQSSTDATRTFLLIFAALGLVHRAELI